MSRVCIINLSIVAVVKVECNMYVSMASVEWKKMQATMDPRWNTNAISCSKWCHKINWTMPITVISRLVWPKSYTYMSVSVCGAVTVKGDRRHMDWQLKSCVAREYKSQFWAGLKSVSEEVLPVVKYSRCVWLKKRMMHLLRLVTEQSSTIGKEELRARPTLTVWSPTVH